MIVDVVTRSTLARRLGISYAAAGSRLRVLLAAGRAVPVGRGRAGRVGRPCEIYVVLA